MTKLPNVLPSTSRILPTGSRIYRESPDQSIRHRSVELVAHNVLPPAPCFRAWLANAILKRCICGALRIVTTVAGACKTHRRRRPTAPAVRRDGRENSAAQYVMPASLQPKAKCPLLHLLHLLNYV